MKKIRKKVWPVFFRSILAGDKNFELRLNDFECRIGDVLILEEWNPETQKYTGRVLVKKVGYVLKLNPHKVPFWPKKEIKKHGLQIISLK